MLVLTRRVGEKLVIGNDIVVTVLAERSDGVRIGIEAPSHIRITRAEILEAIERENAAAADAGDDALAALARLKPPTA